ncbi:CidB/LrgB family autolysis modulator [Paenibacillus sp. JCM 10914]|uniref:CidB/LrgB family autolysis modulator n=1 Tax=Paenibacillus sp. JCM 10914 TaxID=1236974 RepID=UPI0003CCBAD0|nr:CidB/LrgB family autolysis modulator [Paenibacillus sp. JCM 10914]GAE06686.1 CidA-associated membrane protein CidB [Paenibacillus sp. JCM 10914]
MQPLHPLFFGLILTTGIYYAAKLLYRRVPKVYLSPLLLTPLLLIMILTQSGISFETYNEGAHWISKLLGPATIAFAVPLYKNVQILKKHAAEIVLSVLTGSLLAIVTTAWLAKLLHLNRELAFSLVPRSVTTPIAMDVSEVIGGVPHITAIFVIMTGIIGSIIGPILMRILHIHGDIARGILLGTGAHGTGTSKAFEFSSLSGTISSISMILAALLTLGIAPLIMSFL